MDFLLKVNNIKDSNTKRIKLFRKNKIETILRAHKLTSFLVEYDDNDNNIFKVDDRDDQKYDQDGYMLAFQAQDKEGYYTLTPLSEENLKPLLVKLPKQ